MSEKRTGETRFELDTANPPTMPEERMTALRTMTDEDIDLRDAPPQLGQPTRRVYGPRFGKPQELVALEPDVLEFFKTGGEVPAERINTVLREYADAHRKVGAGGQ